MSVAGYVSVLMNKWHFFAFNNVFSAFILGLNCTLNCFLVMRLRLPDV